MTKFKFISVFKLYLCQQRTYCYISKTKYFIELLNFLWLENLIWGYVECKKTIRVYLKYYKNKPIVNFRRFGKKNVSLVQLKKYVKLHPQSLFIIKTHEGLKSQDYCLKRNISGELFIKIN